uniref:Uncharacterized protein n=1 Tax=Glossina austeni TaxID=7395 RepID=A0A1A9VBJ3_GLOAU
MQRCRTHNNCNICVSNNTASISIELCYEEYRLICVQKSVFAIGADVDDNASDQVNYQLFCQNIRYRRYVSTHIKNSLFNILVTAFRNHQDVRTDRNVFKNLNLRELMPDYSYRLVVYAISVIVK